MPIVMVYTVEITDIIFHPIFYIFTINASKIRILLDILAIDQFLRTSTDLVNTPSEYMQLRFMLSYALLK